MALTSMLPADAALAALRSDPAKRRNAPAVWMLLLVLLACQAGFCWSSRYSSANAKVDFRVFYTAGHLLLTHHGAQLYDAGVQQAAQSALFHGGRTLPFLYPACTAVLFTPFALLPYKVAFAVSMLVNLLLLIVAVLLLRNASPGLRRVPLPLAVGAACCLFPASIALMQGQISFLLLAVFCAAQVLLVEERHVAAGAVLALALIKFQIALPVAMLFLLWRHWRVCAGFACGAVLLAGASLAVTGPAGMRGYRAQMTHISATTVHDPAQAHAAYGMSAGDMPNLHGVAAKLTHGAPAGQVVCGVLSLALLAWAARRRPSLPLALCAAMLVSYHMQAYDLVLLLLPLALAAGKLLQAKAHPQTSLPDAAGRMPALFWASLLLLVVPAAPVVLVMGASALFALAIAGCLLLSPALQPELSPSSRAMRR